MGQEPVSGFLPLIFSQIHQKYEIKISAAAVSRSISSASMHLKRHVPDHAISKKRQFYEHSISGNFRIQHLRFL